jgi:hypothetical protein
MLEGGISPGALFFDGGGSRDFVVHFLEHNLHLIHVLALPIIDEGATAFEVVVSEFPMSWSSWLAGLQILADYPFLERQDILAAIEYAARQADHSVVHAS